MPIKSFEDLFIEELSDIYSAEKQLTKALPKVAKAASNEDLKKAVSDHLEETENQVKRIEKIVKEENLTLKRKKCAAMEGLISEADEAISSIEQGPLLDVALIMGAQKVEHYEISAYGSLIELAKLLGYDAAVDLLDETLGEEKGADSKLNDIAVSGVNEDAQEMRASL